jgi:phage tail sheath protein FI
MPEYLAPGVYVEETSFRSKSIEGVSTTTTGFIGPCRYGPLTLEPDIVTSLGEFERIYGGREKLSSHMPRNSTIPLARRPRFDDSGKRLYISRVFSTSLDDPLRARHRGPAATPASALTVRSVPGRWQLRVH